jgi:hypothetical protein
MKGNIKGIIALISLLLSALGVSLLLYPNVTSSISSSADAFVYVNMPNLNTGSYSEIQSSITWQDSTPGDLRYAYFMFDISSIPSYAIVTDVRLQIYVSFVSTLDRLDSGYKESDDGQMYGATWAETNWAETTVTWNNQPASGIPGAWEWQLFGGKWGFTSGYFIWKLGGTKERLMTHLKTDKKMAFVIFPDPMNRQNYCDTSFINIKTKEYGGGFEPKLYVDYTIPSFQLTVSVKDADGVAVQGASVTSPFTATTDASGLASSSISAGSYTVKVEYQGLTYTQSVTLDVDKTVSVTVPKYTLTIKTVDPNGKPLPEAIVTSPVSGKTDSTGTFSTRLKAGSYTVAVAFGTVQKSDSVLLSSDKTVTITLTPEYTINFIVKDQVGNPLPAKVTFDGSSLTCDKTGVSPQTKITKTQLTIKAEIKVGTQTYSATEALTLTKSMTKEITITRRFYWTFSINYTDGSLATGTLTASSTKETLTTPITSGYGEAYLTDATYTFSFEASPAVSLKTVTITNDGDLVATIDKAKATAETSHTEIPTTSSTSPTVTPAIPWILIPSIYIYALIGVLAFGFILAVIVRIRRK